MTADAILNMDGSNGIYGHVNNFRVVFFEPNA